jgi:hypothetical protein
MDIFNLDIDLKYKKWLNMVYKGGDLHPSFNFICQKHKRLIDKIPVEFRDIFSFKTINDFIFYVDSLESETEKEEKIKNDGSKVIYENEDFIVKSVFTMEAMFLYGKGTKWCISSEINNQWDSYIKNGDMFFLVFSKKLPYDSQLKKFIVQLTSDKLVYIWDKSDNCYSSNIFDLINIDMNLFLDYYKSSIIDSLCNVHIDSDVINILTNNNAIIAGGALTSIILDEKINDFDIWFSNENDYQNAINDMDNLHYGLKKSFSKHVTINAITFTIENKKYQIINPLRYSFGGVNEIINQFDFTCVMCGVDISKKQIVYNERFFTDIRGKVIIINKRLKTPTSLISRVIKYSKKGYRVSIDTERDILRILSKVSEQEINHAVLTMY